MVGPFQILLILFILAIFFLLPLIAIIDIVRNEFTGNNKIVWVLIVLLFPVIGAIIYFIVGEGQKLPKN
jgi:hypothetical protein